MSGEQCQFDLGIDCPETGIAVRLATIPPRRRLPDHPPCGPAHEMGRCNWVGSPGFSDELWFGSLGPAAAGTGSLRRICSCENSHYPANFQKTP